MRDEKRANENVHERVETRLIGEGREARGEVGDNCDYIEGARGKRCEMEQWWDNERMRECPYIC